MSFLAEQNYPQTDGNTKIADHVRSDTRKEKGWLKMGKIETDYEKQIQSENVPSFRG